MSIVRIPGNSHNAAGRTIRAAESARDAGFENVQTHYKPASDTHVVTGTLPAATAQRTIDRLLGR